MTLQVTLTGVQGFDLPSPISMTYVDCNGFTSSTTEGGSYLTDSESVIQSSNMFCILNLTCLMW
jgi:hypothetical protein